MQLTRFEPWSLADLLSRDLERIAARQFPNRRYVSNDADDAVADWAPAVDVIEEKDRFVLRADVPGVDPEAIDVSMDAGILSVSGHRDETSPGEEAGLKRIERVNGRFYRRFSLPDTADADGIKASCRNGILEVTIPKQREVQARRIRVEAA